MIDPATGNVSLVAAQPGDFALGELMSVGWGMAAHSQWFGGDLRRASVLLTAICYSGAYAADINLEDPDPAHPFVLSPPDMDEATSAVLDLVGLDRAFGARGTSGLDRVRAFVRGYHGGLAAC